MTGLTSNTRYGIVHIIKHDKFIPAFIDFLERHFEDFNKHQFFITGDVSRYPFKIRKNIIVVSELDKGARRQVLHSLTSHAQKIILHGLFDSNIVKYLAFHPWLLKKCSWVIWGGDLYSYKYAPRTRVWFYNEVMRRVVIKRIGILVSSIKGDIQLARDWYSATGKAKYIFIYPANIFKGELLYNKKSTTIKIQIGNSADPANNHMEMIEILKPYKSQNILIYAPLSYGDSTYAKEIISYGKKCFGAKFIPMDTFLPFGEYYDYLYNIDIAMFNHKRQQAVGNTTTLLGMGKKIYMRKDVNTWDHFIDMGMIIYDIFNFDIDLINYEVANNNAVRISQIFSEEKLVMNLHQLLDN